MTTPQPPMSAETMKARRTAVTETPNRSASPRATPPSHAPLRGRVHSRAGGGCVIQLVQWAQRVAPGAFSVRQYGQSTGASFAVRGSIVRPYARRGALFRP